MQRGGRQRTSPWSGWLCPSVLAVVLTASALGADGVPGDSGTPPGSAPSACQIAGLRNGFSIQFIRREVTGLMTRLWLCDSAGSGYADVPSDQIESVEQMPVALRPAQSPAPTTEKAVRELPPSKVPIDNLIVSAATRHQIDPDFLSSVVKAESGFNPNAISPKGARGLMQLMPQTAISFGVENAFDPTANLEAGTKYLRQLLDQYDGDPVKALSAYNAGALRVAQYGGMPPYPETRAYVTRIADDYNRKKLQQQAHSTVAPSGE